MKNITFINAGAGSGKTFSLTDKLYSFIKDGRCRGDQVMLTTFTKNAAEEIRQRAFTKLLENGKTEDAIALQNAFIGTVHSVGYRMIGKFCYLIGISPEIRELSEEDTDFYFSQAISAVPTPEDLNKIAELSEKFQFQAWDGGFTSSYNPNKWQDHVKKIIGEARRNNINDLSEDGLSFSKSLEFISAVLGGGNQKELDLKKISSETEEVIKYLEQLPDNKNVTIKKAGQELKTNLYTKKSSYAVFLDIFDTASDILNRKDSTHIPSQNLVNMLGSFYQSSTMFNDIVDYMRLIFKISGNCLKEFEDYKKKHALVDFSDMETLFLELLDKPEVETELKQTIRILMVDEFQDSNPIQLAIFLKLAEIVEQSIWVGDPKQAIYGFNGSDPVMVSKLLELFYKENESNLRLQLLKNSWRSRPDLVSIVNKMFGKSLENQSFPAIISKEDVLGQGSGIEQWKKEKFMSKESIELSPRDSISLIPVRNEDEEGFATAASTLALSHWHFINKFKGAGNKAQFSYYLGKKIKKLLTEDIKVFDKTKKQVRSLKPSDIAILCRKNSEVKAISSELLNNGIEAAAIVEGLSSTAEYRLLINILNYIADQGNSLSITEIMLLIKEEEEITAESLLENRLTFLSKAPSKDDADSSAYFNYLQQWGKEHPFIKNLESFAANSRHLSVPELIEKMFAVLELRKFISAWGNSEQRLANIQQLIKYAWEYDDYCVKLNIASSLIGFVVWMGLNSERNNQAASASENAVNVLTYHKSKGLEWPFVILTSLDYKYNKGFLHKDFFRMSVKMEGDLDIKNPLQNRYINFIFWPFGGKEKIMGYEEDIFTSQIYQEAETSKRNETIRLLYVGMTRARDYLVTTSLKEIDSHWFNLACGHDEAWTLKSKTQANVSNQITDLFDHPVNINYQVQADPDENFSPAYEDPEYKPGIYFEKQGIKLQDNPKYVSPSRLKAEKEVKVEYVIDFNNRIKTGKFENEALLGNCLHDILYLWPENPDSAKVEAIIGRHNLMGQVNVSDTLIAVQKTKEYILSLKPIASYREMPMRMSMDTKILAGSADLVLEFEKELFLIDYKSYPGSIKEVLDPKSKHFAGIYAGQLDAYAEMLEAAIGKKVIRKMIYFAVLGKIVELV